MTALASDDKRMPNDEAHLPILAESADDSHGTRMAYQSDVQVPWYIVAAWTALAVAYVTYQLIYLLPDLRAWFAAS